MIFVARGQKELIDSVLERIRQQTEVEGTEGFLIFHSLGGGTGSGLTTLLLDGLADYYDKHAKLQFSTLSASMVFFLNTID